MLLMYRRVAKCDVHFTDADADVLTNPPKCTAGVVALVGRAA
jgi:hypothetical protein